MSDLPVINCPVVCLYSGGVCSHLAAKRAVARFGAEAVTLLFNDTRMEDKDLYRFLDQGAAALGCKLVKASDGRNIFELARQERAIPTNRMPFCSRILKKEVGDKWIAENAPDALLIFGIDWTENRTEGVSARVRPHETWFPMTEAPYLTKSQMLAELRADGIEPPALYGDGFAHNNCGGACVRAGQAAWAHLLRMRPDTYGQWEAFESEMRTTLGKDVSILADRRGSKIKKPLTLESFRLRVQQQHGYDEYDWGGCGCYFGEESTV